MIRNEKEYQEALKRIRQDKEVIKAQENKMKSMRLSEKEIKRAMDPVLSFHAQLQEEVKWYERVKRQDFSPLASLNGIGRLLVALRIASGLTQKELADCLGVPESQVSRDERNEYHGISIDRAQKIMNLFHVRLNSKVELAEPLERKKILSEAATA